MNLYNATVPGSDHPLIGSWKTGFIIDGRDIRVEYRFAADGSGVERIIFNDSENDDIHNFSWNTKGALIQFAYSADTNIPVMIRYGIDGDTCDLSDPDYMEDSMILKRYG